MHAIANWFSLNLPPAPLSLKMSYEVLPGNDMGKLEEMFSFSMPPPPPSTSKIHHALHAAPLHASIGDNFSEAVRIGTEGTTNEQKEFVNEIISFSLPSFLIPSLLAVS